jgi:acyl-CoA 6-desaturase (Delta-6 desaturase)
LGEKIPKWWAEKKKGFMPYNWQQNYWFIIGPPLLLPTYFHYVGGVGSICSHVWLF